MKNKRILVLGTGFLGSQIKKTLDCRGSGKIINHFKDADAIVRAAMPKIIINCIGETGRRNVDDCETDKHKTLHANTVIPIILGDIAYRYKIKLIHISSGCIFHYDYRKDAPITEEKNPDYFSLYYSRTKIYAEQALRSFFKRTNILIIRIRIPLDDKKHPKNLLTKLLGYKKIIDVPNSVTYIPDFLKALKHLIAIDAKGIYHVALRDPLNYPFILEEYRKYDPSFTYTPIKPEKLGRNRTNLILSTRKLEKTGFNVRSIREVIPECVKKYVNS